MARWEHFYMDIWRVNTTAVGLNALLQGFHDFRSNFPEGVGLITIVEPGAPLPSAEVRQGAARVLTEVAPYVRYSAVVFEGTGFRAAAVRGVVTSMIMLGRPSYPHRVFGSVTEACNWFQRSFGIEQVDARMLESAIAELRRRIGVQV
jgi:hypothetical protein